MNHTIRVAFCGVLAGLGLALMFLTALLPMATFALPALAGLLMIMIVIEMGARWAWPTFAVVAILSVFFVPDKQAALLYVIFFGYYPILKALIERLKNKIVQWVLKYAVFNAAIVSAYFIAIYLLSIPADSLSLFEYHCRGYFDCRKCYIFIYDIAITGVVAFYIKQLHKVFRKWFQNKN
ncbi:MAG: hypothetical protein ACLRRA_06795 [Acutalibacteraceae bacterium]